MSDPLASPAPAFELEAVATMAEALLGSSKGLHVVALESERDQNFLVKTERDLEYVLKISNSADEEQTIAMQTAALLHIERQDPALPVMRPIPLEAGEYWKEITGPDGRPHLVRLLSGLPGRQVVPADFSPRLLRRVGELTARLGLSLRGFVHAGGVHNLLWNVNEALRLRPLVEFLEVPNERVAVLSVLDRFESQVLPLLPSLRAQVIHNDITPFNVLCDEFGNVTGIVDFGDMTHTALLVDLAVAIASFAPLYTTPLAAASDVLAGYQEVLALELGEQELLLDIVAVRLAAIVIITAWRGSDRAGMANRARELPFGLRTKAFALLEELIEARFPTLIASGSELHPSADASTALDIGSLVKRRDRVLGAAPHMYDRPLHIVSARDVWMFDSSGRRYLDAYNNVPIVGHCHPVVVQAVASQLGKLNTNVRYLHEAVIEAAEELIETMPSGLDRVFFVNSGSEADDVAWRLAREFTGKRGGVVSSGSYFGLTNATAALSPVSWGIGDTSGDIKVFVSPDGFRGPHVREEGGWESRYAELVEGAIDAADTSSAGFAALVMDALFTNDGMLVPPSQYLAEAVGAVKRHGGLVIADEIQGGFGRTGEHMWGFQRTEIVPDIVTLGKPMGNGFPVGAVISRGEIVDRLTDRTSLFSTFGGNPVASVAVLSVLRVIRTEGLRERSSSVGAYLRRGLEELKCLYEQVGDVRSIGLLAGVEIVRGAEGRVPAPDVARWIKNDMLDRGVLIGTTGPLGNILKIRPPLTFLSPHVDVLLEALDQSLAHSQHLTMAKV